MDDVFLKNCTLFAGLNAKELRDDLSIVPQHIQCYEKDEIIFHFMEQAETIGIILKGEVDSVKPFPNGKEVNVTARHPGDLIGPAAVFSVRHQYPCDLRARKPTTLMMLHKEDILRLMQKDLRILENFTRELATATYLLQERLELLSYSGIAQKIAHYLLMQSRKKGTARIRIPESSSHWAALMNVSRPSLHRELHSMEMKGIVAYQAPFISILDAEALERVLQK